MWRVSLADLRWRRRRVLVALAATALVFAVTLLLAGADATLKAEPGRIVGVVGADAWVMPAGASGPFTASSAMPAAAAEEVAGTAGVGRADPLVLLHSALRVGDGLRDVNVVGHRPGGLGQAPVSEGRPATGLGDVVVDRLLGLDVGDEVVAGGQRLTVVGVADGVTYYFGTPTVFVTLEQAQRTWFEGQPLASVVVTEGRPQHLPAGLVAMSDDAVVDDLQRPTESGAQTIGVLNALLWIVAAGIVGSTIYVTAIERTRDFAVLKAVGASPRSLLAGLLLQALLLTLVAAGLGAVLARLLAPVFPFPVILPASAHLSLAAVAVAVGAVASLAALRRVVHADPALAFGGP